MGCHPGPTNHNPFSRLGAPRTPGPLGRNDAADPGTMACRGETPGTLGLNDDALVETSSLLDPMDYDFLVRHRQTKSHLIESVPLADFKLKDKIWAGKSIWKLEGAVIFRVSNLAEDLDGSGQAYHPPTDASWNGYGHGLGKDSLANAVGNPGVTKYAHSKKEQDWALVAGCQVFRDLHKAKGLEPKLAAAKAAKPPLDKAAADKAAKDLKDMQDALDKIFKDHGVTKLSELEDKGKTAVCVLYVDGRSKKDSQADWSHVVHWAGIQTDKSGKPVVRSKGPNAGFYIPQITPAWADAEKHPWVVLNSPQDKYGVKLTNSAVVIKNDETPSIAYGMVADKGPGGHLGEVSRKMMDDLGFTGSTPAGDYIIIQFPENVSDGDIGKEKTVAAIQADAKAMFEAWTWEGRSGLELIKELFPTPDQYKRAQKDFANARTYMPSYIDHLKLELK